ncbi:hypothetical protein SAMN06265360_12710 [Haloechinothrix alba]|uniref:Uncharacterized protein n=2 Tax=Haloechinothrix alba TaxID=664784 RepID=A0A238ZX51_9PSEU|nr:hypothetical protein SAMN06265360_12710 [Haloechinothrix alba]
MQAFWILMLLALFGTPVLLVVVWDRIDRIRSRAAAGRHRAVEHDPEGWPPHRHPLASDEVRPVQR